MFFKDYAFFSVKDPAYGAVGDGVADDGTAIQNAMTAAAAAGGGRGGLVFVPPGYYKHAAGLTKPANVSLVGAGPWASCLHYTGATGYGLTIGDAANTGSTPANETGVVENLCFEGNSSTNTATAIRVVKCIEATLRNLTVRTIGTALELTGSTGSGLEWTGLHWIANLNTTQVTNGVYFNGWVTDTVFCGGELNGKGGTAGSRVGTGLHLTDRTATCHFFGQNAEGFATGYWIETTGSSGSEFVSPRVENCDAHILWGTSSTNYLFVGGNGVFGDPDANNFYNGATTLRGTLTLIQRDGYFPKIAAPPAASASDRWRINRVQGGTGAADHLYVYYKDASDTYQRADLLAPAGGAGSNTPLAYKVYNPGTPASLTSAINNNAFQDVDATNLVVTFTAPASGNVLVRLTGLAIRNDSTTTKVFWGLRDAGGYVAGSGGKVLDGTGIPLPASVAFAMTGLTPGNSYTWKWAHRPKESGATSQAKLQVGGDPSSTATDANGPATMEVWAL